MDFTNITDLNHCPMLKALLINYILTNYEENAITDDEHLMAEYLWLKNHNKLGLLFECEYMNNYFAKVSA